MTKKYPSSVFPSLLHNPLESLVNSSMQSLTFQVPLALPSWVVHPLARLPHIGRYKNHGISLPQNHHISHIMPIAINGHYWALVSHNGPTPKGFTNILVLVSIPLLSLIILAVLFNHSTKHVHAFLFQEHNFHLIQNKLKSIHIIPLW